MIQAFPSVSACKKNTSETKMESTRCPVSTYFFKTISPKKNTQESFESQEPTEGSKWNRSPLSVSSAPTSGIVKQGLGHAAKWSLSEVKSTKAKTQLKPRFWSRSAWRRRCFRWILTPEKNWTTPKTQIVPVAPLKENGTYGFLCFPGGLVFGGNKQRSRNETVPLNL